MENQLYKDIKIGERTFRLNKFNARTGSYMLFKLIGMLSPVFKNVNASKIEDLSLDDLNFTDLIAGLTDLPEKDFRYIQDNCLRSIQEILPAGPTQVLDEYGKYGALNVEFDLMLVLNLTAQSLIFNVSGFFNAGPLSSILKQKLATFQQNAQM